jgi:hypothetical protein
VAFVPVARPQIDAQPSDWEAQILRRVYYDPTTLGDISLRTFIQRTSHGRADIEGVVLPRVELNQLDVPVGALGNRTSELREQGFDAGALVMLGGVGAGTAERLGFWARFVMLESVGVWAMELIHVLAQFGDLYLGPNGILTDHLGSFDTMAGATGSHLSAYTKRTLGWIDGGVVFSHVGGSQVYDLHDVGLPQPPPIGRASAVEIGSLVVEAREMVDQFDARIRAATPGAPPQGVIVYEVENPDIDADALVHPFIRLKTPDPIQPGGVFISSNGVTVRVLQSIPGGYTIQVTGGIEWATVPNVREESVELAADHVQAAGLVPKFTGAGTWVFSQSPLAGHVVPKGSTVTMHLHTGPVL